MDVVNLANETQTLPDSFSMALITVVHKKNKNPPKCSSYRPISLLNTDFKIISKALTNRLNRFLPKLINIDQTGFINKRLATDNLRRLFNIIHLANARSDPTIALSLDAEKAFDCLEWPYLLKVLDSFGFSASFINWVKTLYHKPQAKIATNGITSTPITLQRSSRQGCPLSAGLFVLALEPLAQAVRQDPDIKGIKVVYSTHKISLFADDVVLCLSDLARSLAKLQVLLESYSILSL